MIGTSLPEYILIRFWVLFFRYTPLLYILLLPPSLIYSRAFTRTLCWLLLAEALFYASIYRPCVSHQSRAKAAHPTPLSPQERRDLFDRCMGEVHDMQAYLRWWFQGVDGDELRRENLRDFLFWAFFDLSSHEGDMSPSASAEVGEYVAVIEARLGRELPPGRGGARCIRLTLDDVESTYRSLLWYVVIFFVDQAAHLALSWHSFTLYARRPGLVGRTFPPRPQELFAKRSPAPAMSYYYRPHRSGLPLVFVHGIGVGLWTYVRFLADINPDIGIVAVEILPVCFRLTSPPLDRIEFLRQITLILNHHSWERFALASHSYGSVPSAHMLRSPLQTRISSVILIDPVSVNLHHPDVAWNFTRKKPREANEWQLWYFASTDPGVAHCLARHFFWHENILWREDLSNAVVCLAGRDVLVDTGRIAGYLRDVRGVEVLMFPELDHAQVFDSPRECRKVVKAIERHCS